MLDTTLLLLFIPTFLVISATPGMCMTLALTLGMSIGVRRTMYMMWGELIGVALVSVLAVVGVASIMLNYPSAFLVLKYAGGAYLVYLGIQMWRSRGKMAINLDDHCPNSVSGKQLAMQGFVTAIANPKGWAFTVSLLPSFINPTLAMPPQLSALVVIILLSEFMFLMIYATGGKTLRRLLQRSNNVRLINRLSGSLMIAVGIWLALG
ncbi:LysE family translocator [Kangiella spongicola]|uniref:Threonine transporter RhtB n=1 Tax=Kangiella spongicola TaxID=796379 RepID=A0A318D6F4_9GAMM|nr:LysE family translocator [Kangiella spongicola]PXF62774.1 threonine transporter RhtB [Kangiella spongicola]